MVVLETSTPESLAPTPVRLFHIGSY